MLRNLGFSAASNLSRFLASGVLFIVLAAFWPPELFGRFVFHNVLALMAAMAVDYGLSVKTMRDIADAHASAKSVLLAALRAQLWLLPLSGGIGVALWALGLVTHPVLFAFLWVGQALFALLNTAYGALRGLGRFDAEARIALLGNSAYFVIPLAIVWGGGGAEAVAGGMVAARLLQGAAAAFSLRSLGPRVPHGGYSAGRILRDARPYALESWTSALFQHTDSLIVRLILGEAALGLYQAGARFLAVAIILVQSLGNLAVPSLTRARSDGPAFRRALGRSGLAFAALGVICLFLLAVPGPPFVRLVYGNAYEAVGTLMPLFGLVALIRCLAAGQGMALLALGRQTERFYAVLAALALFVPAGLLGARFGVAGVVWAGAAAAAFLGGLYWWRLRNAMPTAAVRRR